MNVINIDFSLEAKNAKTQALNELVYEQWKSKKRLELIMRDSMDNLEELALQMSLKSSAFSFEEVQILPPQEDVLSTKIANHMANSRPVPRAQESA